MLARPRPDPNRVGGLRNRGQVMTEEKKPDYAFGNYHADVQQDDPDDVQLMTPEESAKVAENVREMMETRPNTTATR